MTHTRLLICALFFGCASSGTTDTGASDTGPTDRGRDAPASDSSLDAPDVSDSSDAADASDASLDSGSGDTALPDTPVDAGPVEAPESIPGEIIVRAPSRVATPPTWNSHIPKLLADDSFFYAIAHHSPDGPTGNRRTRIMRRPRSGGEWVQAALMTGIHQPPAGAFDSEDRFHLAFDCLRNGTVAHSCFPGGVSSQTLGSRAYHLVFTARMESGALNFARYTNRDEWLQESLGYHGIGSNASGRTVWSFSNASEQRVIQTTTFDTTGTYPATSRAGVQFLYPIHLPIDGGAVLTFIADFQRVGPSNAGYPSATLLRTSASGTETILSIFPTPAVAPGTVGAFPSDLDQDIDGTFLALAWRKDTPADTCNELMRFDDGLDMPPVILPVIHPDARCLGNYSKLQVASDGQYFIIASGGGPHSFRLGQSSDRGATWTWFTIGLDVPGARDDRFIAPTPIEARTSVNAFDPDIIRFAFSGATAAGSDTLYFAELSLEPWL